MNNTTEQANIANSHRSKNSSKLIFLEITAVLLVVMSYFTTKYLMILAAVILSIYILIEKEYTRIICVFFFMLPFSNIFNLGSTSLYLMLKIAIIFKWFIENRTIERKSFLAIMIYVFYITIISTIFGTIFGAVIRILNFALWFLTIYIFGTKIKADTFYKVSIHYIGALLTSCVVALFADSIPGLKEQITDATILGSADRFSGLWNDPNTFSVFMGVGIVLTFLLYMKRYVMFKTVVALALALTVFSLYSYSKMCLLIVTAIWIGIIMFGKTLSITKRIGIILGLAVTCAVIYFIFPQIIEVYLMRLINDSANNFSFDSLTTKRSSIWQMYISSMSENPIEWILGNGINCTLPNNRAAHQTVLQVIYQIGIIGMIIYIYTLGCILSVIKRQTHNERRKKIQDIIPIVPIFIIIFGAMFLDYFFLENFYFLLFLGVIAYYGSRGNEQIHLFRNRPF